MLEMTAAMTNAFRIDFSYARVLLWVRMIPQHDSFQPLVVAGRSDRSRRLN
jgi:hypothetical protein